MSLQEAPALSQLASSRRSPGSAEEDGPRVSLCSVQVSGAEGEAGLPPEELCPAGPG